MMGAPASASGPSATAAIREQLYLYPHPLSLARNSGRGRAHPAGR